MHINASSVQACLSSATQPHAPEETMSTKRHISIVTLLFGFALFTGCQRISEPWDTADYFKEERIRTAEQQQALQHRLASMNSGDELWAHAQH